MKVTVDCSKCDGEKCCTYEAQPMGLPLRCVHCKDGKCLIEDEKYSSCALHPVIVVGNHNGIFVCVDTGCPEHENIDSAEVARVINYYAEKGELVVFSEDDVEFFGWKLKPIAKID